MATAPPPLPNSRRRIWIALCLALPCLLAVLFAVLAIPTYNWRSERAFHAHVAELEAIGETLRMERSLETGDWVWRLALPKGSDEAGASD